MSKAFRPMRAAQAPPSMAPAPRRSAGSVIRKGAGHFYLVPLLFLLYIIVYQNLPEDLNGFTLKPFSTAGPIDRSIKIGTILLSLAVILSRWSFARLFLKELNPGLIACMVLIPVSAVWSIDSNATLLRFITLLHMFLLCLAIPLAGWDRRRFQGVVTPAIMVLLGLSLLVGMIDPHAVKEIGDDISLANSWRGVLFQKNQFGMTASFGVILCAHRLLVPGKFSPWSIVGLGVSLLCLTLSRSSTSLLATMLALLFIVLMMRVPVIKRSFSTLLVVGLFTTIIIYELAIQNLIPGVATLLKPVMGLTGKDMTFSARSVIWEIVKEHSRAAPWLGSGYGAYWTGETGNSPSVVFMFVMNFYPSTSHNGYLEILNDLGRLGLVCLLAFLVWFVRQSLRMIQFDRNQAVLYLALLYQQMVANLSESEWFSRSTICILFLLCSTCMARALLEQRLIAPKAPMAGKVAESRTPSRRH